MTLIFFPQIMFDNHAQSGKIMVDVENDVRIYECRDWNVEGTCEFFQQMFISSPCKSNYIRSIL